MTFSEASDEYWKYYISLEEQFIETGRYVELDFINNGKTYSMEYLKLFQAVCSEIDVVGKVLASLLDTSFVPTKSTGINEWWYYISNKEPSFESMSCRLFDEHDLRPWKNFRVVKNTNTGSKKYILHETTTSKAKTPSWWNDYNSVKHNRTGHYQKNATNYAKANLRNLVYAFAALFLLEGKLMEATRKNNETIHTGLESKLFVGVLPFYKIFLSIR